MAEIDYIFERTKGVCFMEHIIEQLVEGKYNFNVIVCQLFNLLLHIVFEDFELYVLKSQKNYSLKLNIIKPYFLHVL